METDILPLATGLVAAPYSGIALRSGPTVQRNDEGTRVATIIRHDLRHVRHTVQAEAVSGAHPCHVGLEHTHTGVTYFLHDIALQKGFNTFLGMQVALGPETNFNTLAAGIVAKFFQVLHIAVQGLGLPVSRPVSVVRKEPSQGIVVVQITVYGGTRTELIVILLAVQALADTAVVLLAFVISLAVLIGHKAVLRLGPVVAVISVKVSLIETELGQKHRIAGQLVIVIE